MQVVNAIYFHSINLFLFLDKIYVTKAVGDLLNNMETSALSNVYTVQSKMEINKQFEALRNLYSLKLEGVIDGVEVIL